MLSDRTELTRGSALFLRELFSPEVYWPSSLAGPSHVGVQGACCES